MWPNPQFSADLVIFTEEILNVKLHFLCSVMIAFGIDPNVFIVLSIFLFYKAKCARLKNRARLRGFAAFVHFNNFNNLNNYLLTHVNLTFYKTSSF